MLLFSFMTHGGKLLTNSGKLHNNTGHVTYDISTRYKPINTVFKLFHSKEFHSSHTDHISLSKQLPGIYFIFMSESIKHN